jgi:phosphoglycolate phosphatase-like HAD superfamily hydrolase
MSDAIEIRPGFIAPAGLRHAVFDWDGTLSFIRAGWGEVMLDVFLDHLPPLAGETVAQRGALAHDDIWRLNGKPTIHQMQCLADRVAERGGQPLTATGYQQEYAKRLGHVVQDRIESVVSGRTPAASKQPPGALACILAFRDCGLVLHVVSGTEVRYVRREVEALGLSTLFENRVHGPTGPDDRAYTKRGVMELILANDQLPGSALVALGDGHVEIEQAKALGGTAVAVATDEEHFGSGRIDPAKRTRLVGVGADVVIPDYSDLPGLLRALGLTPPAAA